MGKMIGFLQCLVVTCRYAIVIMLLGGGCALSAHAEGVIDLNGAEQLEVVDGEEVEEEIDSDRFEQRVKNALASFGRSNHNQIEQAIFFFEAMGDEAIPHLEKELIDKEEKKRHRNNIIYALGRLGYEARLAVPTMLEYLRHEDAETRAVTVIALGKMEKHARPAVKLVAQLLSDEDEWVRKAAYDSLKKIGGPIAKIALNRYNRDNGYIER